MKSSADIIQWLNRQLQHELTAINQYFLHARMYENWGFNSLNKREYEESIEEMKHADALIKPLTGLERRAGNPAGLLVLSRKQKSGGAYKSVDAYFNRKRMN
jgi:bacterioferritin (cytochrome b1)